MNDLCSTLITRYEKYPFLPAGCLAGLRELSGH